MHARNLKFPTVLLLAIFFVLTAKSQSISRFDFNSTATIGTATTGPDGTFYNPNSDATGGVARITAGCGPGLGLDLTVPGNTFDVDNMQIDVRFQRTGNETVGEFFRRGNMYFGFTGTRLYAQFDIDDGAGNPQTVFLPTDYVVSNSNFQTYTFSYDNCSGIAYLAFNDIIIAYIDGPDDRAMLWDATSEGIIGSEIDNGCSGEYGMDFINIYGNSIACLSLPVEFSSFTAQTVGQNIRLDWTTASESNNDFFTVERAANDGAFETINFLPGAGTTSQSTDYQFLDQEPPAGILHYRILQTDFDGNTSASEVVTLNSPVQEAKMQVYPNPSAGQFNLKLELPEPEQTVLTVYNLQGQAIFKEDLSVETGALVKNYDFSALPAGLYVVYVEGRNFALREKVWLH